MKSLDLAVSGEMVIGVLTEVLLLAAAEGEQFALVHHVVVAEAAFRGVASGLDLDPTSV